jgi:hypothetical protein
MSVDFWLRDAIHDYDIKLARDRAAAGRFPWSRECSQPNAGRVWLPPGDVPPVVGIGHAKPVWPAAVKLDALPTARIRTGAAASLALVRTRGPALHKP